MKKVPPSPGPLVVPNNWLFGFSTHIKKLEVNIHILEKMYSIYLPFVVWIMSLNDFPASYIYLKIFIKQLKTFFCVNIPHFSLSIYQLMPI